MSRPDTTSRATFVQTIFSICVIVISSAALLGVTVFSIAAGAGEEQMADDPNTVHIANFTFNPDAVRILAGATVTWINGDDIGHTVASVGSRLFRSKTMDNEDKFSFTFTTPGIYEYRCTLHPNMKGTIVVEAKVGDSTSQ
jgi:plastocyanin